DGRDVTGLPAHARVKLGMARTFQITEIFPELSVLENVRIGAEVAAGFQLRPWISRTEKCRVAASHRRDAELGRIVRQDGSAGGRAGARRSARRRDRHGPGVASQAAAAGRA